MVLNETPVIGMLVVSAIFFGLSFELSNRKVHLCYASSAMAAVGLAIQLAELVPFFRKGW